MSGVNKVILIGNLGREPEKVDGQQITKIAVATTERWTDKDSKEKKEKTEWHRVTFFGHLANSAMKYLYKGAKVYIEGKNVTNKWTDENGKDHYTTEVHVREYKLLSAMKDQPDNQQQSSPQQQHQDDKANGYQNQQEPDGGFDDDIPF